jgi:periplasmic protein TonB
MRDRIDELVRAPDDRTATVRDSECTRRIVTVGMPGLRTRGGAWMADVVPEDPMVPDVMVPDAARARPVKKRASKAAGGAPKRRRKAAAVPEVAMTLVDAGVVEVKLDSRADGALVAGEPVAKPRDDGEVVEVERTGESVAWGLGRNADAGPAPVPRLVAERAVPRSLARNADGAPLVAVRRVAARGVVTGLVASRTARVPGLAHWMRAAREDRPRVQAKPFEPKRTESKPSESKRTESRPSEPKPWELWPTPRIEGDFTDRKAPAVDGTERSHAVRQGRGRSIIGVATSAWAHLAIVLALLLIAPTPRLGDMAPEPSSFGLVWDETVKVPPPPAAKAPEQEAPKPSEPQAQAEPAKPPPAPPQSVEAAKEPPPPAPAKTAKTAKAPAAPAETEKASPEPAEAKKAPPPAGLAKTSPPAVDATKPMTDKAPSDAVPPAPAAPVVESVPMQRTVEIRPVPLPQAPPPVSSATPPTDVSASTESRKAEKGHGRPARHARPEQPVAHRKAEQAVRRVARREEKHSKVEKSQPKREVRHEPPQPVVTPQARPVPQPSPQVRPQPQTVVPLPQPPAQRPAVVTPLQAQPMPQQVRPVAPPSSQPPVQRPVPAPLPRVWTPSAMPNAAPETASPRPNPAASPSPAAPAAASSEPAHINADWAGSVTDWLVQHRTYPTDARLRNVQGVVIIRFTVAPDGLVLDVGVVQSSGSKGLDKAAMDMVRGAQLPPFPLDMTQTQQTVTVPIRYGLE